MAEALDPAAYIFEGIWTDWTKGSVQGLTLTLCPTSATFLTNSLALFVTLAGGQLWTILRFTLHQLQTSHQSGNPNVSHNQQQVVLRNATTDLATARLMWIVMWRSRRDANRPSSRAVLIALFAILHATLFMAAGTFSNKFIMTAGSATAPSLVLSRSKHCGTFNETYYETVAEGLNTSSKENLLLSAQFYEKTNQDVELSLAYARECYMQQPTYYMSSTCNTLKKPKFEWTNHTGPCPFPSQMCHKDSETIVFDTGTIDSLNDLGINAKHEDRLSYRRITTCAVLNDTGRVKGWNGSVDPSTNTNSQEIARAYYGPSLYQGTEWTYSYSNFGSFYTEFTPQATVAYQVTAQFADLDFTPIPALRKDSADLFLVFLSYNGRYFDEIHDPWFSAHQLHLEDTHAAFARTQYSRDTAISTLSCTEQHQFCTSTGICTPFSGFDQVQNNNTFKSGLASNQNVTFDRMLRSVDTSSIYNIINGLGKSSTPLLANNETITSTSFLSLHLPDHQWKLELTNLHAIAMSQLQHNIVRWGTGQIAAEPQLGGGLYLMPPATEPDSWFCRNLMIPSTVYQSFSVIAITLIIVFGTLVIVISMTIESMAGCIQKRFTKGPAPLNDWNHDDMLRLESWPNDNSWKPTPPPKDHGPQVAFLPNEPREARERDIVVPSTRNYRATNATEGLKRASSQALPPEYPKFPCFSRPIYAQALNAQQQPDACPEPDRDSWVAISLNSYDAIVPEIRARNILDSGFPRVGKRPTFEYGLSPEIQAIKLHRLAGRQGSWI